MGYVSEIRKYVGHRPIIHAAASVIVENSRGQILLQKRADNGTWSYCGGAVELFEKVVTELKFFDIDCIPEDICPPVREPIKKYIEYRHRDAIF